MDLRQVRAIVTDSKVLSSLEPEVIAGYLQRTGWSDAGQRRTHQVWARMLSDGIATVVVPNDRGFADYPIRMTELLTTLAVVEDRSQLAVLADLVEPVLQLGASRATEGAAASNVIERLEALAEKATPRPWKAADLLDPAVSAFADGARGIQEDAEFVAAVVHALPDLLAVARAAQPVAQQARGGPLEDWQAAVADLRVALDRLFSKESRW
jgi:hypothetical protein